MKTLIGFLLIILLAGCSFIPEYKRPDPPIPKEWPKGEAYENLEQDKAPRVNERPWRNFLPDKKLQWIIEKAFINNKDLKVAALNVERAKAYYGIQRAQLFPAIDAIATGQRQRVPSDLSREGEAEITGQYSVSLGITSWEIDFFGRLRSLKEMALEEYLATEASYKSAGLSLISAVTTAYLTYVTDKENLKLARDTLQTQQHIYDLIKISYELGLISEIDLHRVSTQVETAKEAIARYTQVVAQDKNTLDLLVGEPISEEFLPNGFNDIVWPEDISAGLSSDILFNRPDIIAAEHTLKTYNAQIGAARAAFFPSISLTTLFGTASRELTDLFGGGSRTWTFQPQAIMPIFDARVWAAHEAAKIEREISLVNYQKTIQTAFKEVADVLAVKGTIEGQVKAIENTVISLEQTYKLSKIRYEKGIDSYLSVLDAQRSLFQAQQQLNSLRLSKYLNLVFLYKVLGGSPEE